MSRSEQGLSIVYTGQGKGKTTAALGMVFRALGYGLKVGVVQFVKGKWLTGERLFAESLPQLDFHVMGRGFTWESDDLSRDAAAASAAWDKARELMLGGTHDLLVLDEISYVLNYGFVPETAVLEALSARPAHVTVVLTGRNMPEGLRAAVDLVTDMTLVRHPFQKGQRAVKGVDY
jgi:cob(I)alamin adenosyltransferase